MKTTKKIGFIAAVVLFTLSACNKKDDLQVNTIDGTYTGTITEATLKSTSTTSGSTYNATAEVTKSGQNRIQVHFWGGDMDTTLMLDYYDNHDSIMVCLNDSDYEAMYGQNHMGSGMSSGMGGGMMGNNPNNGTQWGNYMSGSHQAGQLHYGGFDLMGQSFGYTFRMQQGDLNFQGVKMSN